MGNVSPNARTPSLVVGRGFRQRRELQRIERERVRLLRIEPAQQRDGETIEQPDHGSSSGKTCPPAPSGSGLTQSTADSGSVP